MRRFYLPPDALEASSTVITGPDANHIKNVLRLRPGQAIAVFDGIGNTYEAIITSISADAVAVEIKQTLNSKDRNSVEIVLAQALLKSKKMDTIVRQITELGIARWIPFAADRSVPDPDEKRMDKKRARWETIAREALKQCGRSRMPVIENLAAFDDVLKTAGDCDLSLIFWEDETDPVDLLSLRETKPNPAKLLIVVGPEGGFTASEVQRARSANLQSASLGPRILRAETAALAASTLAQFIFGDMGRK